ncbi:MAG: PRC-barrel domain-containing protein [Nanoarchaeota archaeon]|nr:PRC-barrel domain-containing protein [Nanoarchaeota archaeon]
MLKMKKVSETYDLRVFTDSGEYFGDIEDSIVAGNKVSGWKVKATKNSFLSRVLGSAKGVIVPHQMVRAVGDILIVSRNAVPSGGNPAEEEAQE